VGWQLGGMERFKNDFLQKLAGKKIKVEVKMGVAVSFFKKFDCNVKKDLYFFAILHQINCDY
jgi:hypothetical protein